jgi:hypothetical protein
VTKTAKVAAKPRTEKAAAAETALVLRVCDSDMRSHGGFRWPEKGEVSAPDWRPVAECGHGLHGWLFGAGDHSVGAIRADSRWLVVEVVLSEVVMLGGKCKFPRGKVVFCGDRKGATDYLRANEPRSREVGVIGASVEVGEKAHALVGARGTATAGDSGTAIAGYSGTAIAGDSGTAIAGYSGTATAGDSGTAIAGRKGELRIRWYDRKAERYRVSVAYVGEDGIKENTAYKLDDKGKFVEVVR